MPFENKSYNVLGDDLMSMEMRYRLSYMCRIAQSCSLTVVEQFIIRVGEDLQHVGDLDNCPTITEEISILTEFLK